MLGQEKEKTKFLNVMFGKIVESVTKETEGAKERVNKVNQMVYEKHYEFISGKILNIRIEESKDYGDKLMVIMEDMGERYTLQIPVESRYFKSFAMRMPNLKAGQTYCIKPYDFTDNKKKRVTGLNIYEGMTDTGVKIESAYTKENNNGMPEFPAQGDDSEVKIWSIKVTKFLKEVILKFSARFSTAKVNEPTVEKDENDDLPF